MQPYIDLLARQGFTPRDHVKDFGFVIPYVHYVCRKRGSIHEYVSLVSYSTEFMGKKAEEIQKIQGEFCGAVYEIYLAEKNTHKKGTFKPSEMAKRGFSAVFGALPRSLQELEDYVNKPEAGVKELADRLLAQLLQAEKSGAK